MVRFEIELNEREFASGMSGHASRCRGSDSELVDVGSVYDSGELPRRCRISYTGVGQKIRPVKKEALCVLAGHVRKAPFDEQAQIELTSGRVDKQE